MDKAMAEAKRRVEAREWAAAVDALGRVESNGENQFEIAYFLGICHARLGNWDEALLYLEQVVTGGVEVDRDLQCRLALAFVYTVTGRHKLAEYELEKLRGLGVESSQLYAFLGYSCWAQERFEESIGWYSKSLDLDPENANALNGLGYILACEGRDGARALTCCRKAVDKKPNDPAYIDSLAWAYHKLGFSDEARDNITKALALAPGIEEIRRHARAIELGEDLSL